MPQLTVERPRQAWRFGHSLIVALMAGASMLLLALMSMVSVPIAKADDPDAALNALMMGGSGMPTPSEFWRDTTRCALRRLIIECPEASRGDATMTW
jgi:hypothetical protein